MGESRAKGGSVTAVQGGLEEVAAEGGKEGRAQGGKRRRGEGKAAQGGEDYGLLLLQSLGILGVVVSSDSNRYPAPLLNR